MGILQFYKLMFFLSPFWGYVDVQRRVQRCKENIKFSGSSENGDHRYGGICPYYFLSPKMRISKVLSKVTASIATIGTVASTRTSCPYQLRQQSSIFQNWYSENSDRPYGGLRPYHAPISSAPTPIRPDHVAAKPSTGGTVHPYDASDHNINSGRR
jgi:hypothetical protein